MFCFVPARPDALCRVVLLLIATPTITCAGVPGWFVEADVRQVDASGIVSGIAVDDDGTGASIGLGYAFNRHFALLGSYHDMGSFAASDCPPPLLCVTINYGEVDVSGFSLVGTASLPLSETFELFGTAGVLDWDADFSAFPIGDDSRTDVLYGAGAAWWPAPEWRFSLNFERVDFDLDSIRLGVRYQF